MSLALFIDASSSLDALTPVDLAARAPDPITQRFEYEVADAGLFPLFTLQSIGQSAFYIEQLAIQAPTADTIEVAIVLPSGTVEVVPPDPLLDPGQFTNLLVPQGAELRIGATLVGVPVPGTVQIWGYGLGHDTWYRLQCCHVFAPAVPTQSEQEFVLTEDIVGADQALADLLDFAPVVDTVILVLNGVVQSPGAGFDFTLSGAGNRTITWLAATGTAVDMAASDSLNLYYDRI